MPATVKLTPFTTRIPRRILKEVKHEARLLNTKVYHVVWTALEQWLDRRKEQKAA